MSGEIQADAQCQIWSMKGAELTETMWKEAGYKTLADYVLAMIVESKRSLRQQGLDERMFDNLPYCTFGWLDLSTGTKTVVQTSPTKDNLPTTDLVTEDGHKVLTFNKSV